jgi:sugar lactone lactonase YvrE
MRPETIIEEGLVFPESPRWRDGKLWLSDMHAHRVLRVDLAGNVEVIAELDDKPSGIGFLPSGVPIVVSMRHCLVLRLDGSDPAVYADLGQLPVTDLNDLVTDATRRTYVGGRAVTGRDRQGVRRPNGNWPDSIIRIDGDGSAATVANGLRSPNGMALSPDRRTIIVAQTEGRNLLAYDVGSDGGLRDLRIFADLDGRMPDGITLDAEGAVWVACPRDRVFIRVLDGGRITHTIEVDEGIWPVACLLGGPQRDQLFLISSRTTLENQLSCTDFEADKHSIARGRLEVVTVEVPGVGWPE